MSQEKRQVFIEWEDIVNGGGGGTCDGVISFVDLTTVSFMVAAALVFGVCSSVVGCTNLVISPHIHTIILGCH